MLKLVNDRPSEAKIGRAVNTTRPTSHGDRNTSPHSVSRRARLIELGEVSVISATVAIESAPEAW